MRKQPMYKQIQSVLLTYLACVHRPVMVSSFFDSLFVVGQARNFPHIATGLRPSRATVRKAAADLVKQGHVGRTEEGGWYALHPQTPELKNPQGRHVYRVRDGSGPDSFEGTFISEEHMLLGIRLMQEGKYVVKGLDASGVYSTTNRWEVVCHPHSGHRVLNKK